MDDKQRAEALGMTVEQFRFLVGDDPMEGHDGSFNLNAAKDEKKDKKGKDEKGDENGKDKKGKPLPPFLKPKK